MSNRISLPILSQDAGLVRYLEEIRKFPVLTESEENELAFKWYNDGDLEAAQKLVTSHLRLVAKIAMQYRGYGLPMIDVISEGNIGLMTAVKKFDPRMGNRLSTYAMWWIKATIQDYILKSWSMVKMGTSAAHKKLFFNLRKIKNKLFQANNGQVPANEIELIAKELDVSKEDVADMNARFTTQEASLNDNAYGDDVIEVIDTIVEPSLSQEIQLIESDEMDYKREKFANAMLSLNDRERDIINSRRLLEKPIKLEELSQKYGISAERVRQIEDRAFQKLKQAVQENTI